MSVPDAAVYLAAAAGLAFLAWLSVRDATRIRSARRRLLDDAQFCLDQPVLTFGADGLPGLTGTYGGHNVVAGLIPDTMTIRRLPQLWLSVTLLDGNPGLAAFAILVRHAGTEFYSMTNSFDERLEPPAGFPQEVLIRGSSAAAQSVLDALAAPLRAILADPRVKEIAVTPKGVRIVRQTAEGRRGEHLLLRQAMFDVVHVPAAELKRILIQLDGLQSALGPLSKARAA